jgi:hypothetical protein
MLRAFILFLLGSSLAIAACKNASGLEELYSRTKLEFDEGIYYKPAHHAFESIQTKLAPIIIQETETGRSAGQDSDAASDRAVYAFDRQININGRLHIQVIYRWCFSGSFEICVTLDASGHPVIWEVWDAASPTRLFFVAESLEKSAAAKHGMPLPGRRHSVEPDVDFKPDIVVARILDDAPVPMGPIVYISATPRTVSTVACRCMPAQLKQLRDTREYALLPLAEISPEQPVAVKSAGGELQVFLRLPDRF